MIIRKELIVANRKKAAIVADLRKHDFRAFPKVIKVKVVGADDDQEGEGNDDDETEFPDNSTDFDYLLKMAIWNLTQEKVSKFLSQQTSFVIYKFSGGETFVTMQIERRRVAGTSFQDSYGYLDSRSGSTT